MAEQKGPGTPLTRTAFVEANGELFERCFAIPSRSCKQFRREMVTKARLYFGYSEKTIAQDILRPMLKAYTRYIADHRPGLAPVLALDTRGDGLLREPSGQTDSLRSEG